MDKYILSKAYSITIGFIIALAVLAMSACGMHRLPAVPDLVFNQHARIGLLVETGRYPHHTHIGITAIGTSRKVYPYAWALPKFVKDHFVRKIESDGFMVVDLASLDVNYALLDGLVIQDGGRWLVNPEKQAIARLLVDQHKLQAVVLVKEKDVVAEILGKDNYGMDRWNGVNGSGVYSTMGLSGIKYKAVAGVEVRVYTLNPPADLNRYFPLAPDYQWRFRTRPVQNIISPKNRIMITEQEFRQALPVIEKCVEDLADLALCALRRQTDRFPHCYNEILHRKNP